MAGGVDGHGGGIVGLVELLNSHGEAIEYELLTIGKHIDQLGTRRLTWRDLKVVALGSPPNGALHRSVDPEAAAWTPATYLAAALVDYQALALWQNSKKGSPKPRPVPRPHDKPAGKKRNVADVATAALKAKKVADSAG